MNLYWCHNHFYSVTISPNKIVSYKNVESVSVRVLEFMLYNLRLPLMLLLFLSHLILVSRSPCLLLAVWTLWETSQISEIRECSQFRKENWSSNEAWQLLNGSSVWANGQQKRSHEGLKSKPALERFLCFQESPGSNRYLFVLCFWGSFLSCWDHLYLYSCYSTPLSAEIELGILGNWTF